MLASVRTRSRLVQVRYRVGGLDLVDLDVGSLADGSQSFGTRWEWCRVGNFCLCQDAIRVEMCGLG